MTHPWINFEQVAAICNGKVLRLPHDHVPVSYLITDSRKLPPVTGAVFFAIKGERHNGHDHIPGLYRKDVRLFVVESAVAVADFPGAGFIRVKNSIRALQELAAFHRKQFTIPVVAITGSNGKTIVKEWLAQLLSSKMSVIKSPSSFNSQIGVPLSVWQINPSHQAGIFEAGISQPGEMERLETVIRPDMGIFTNIGTAHDEGFEDQAQKIEEKIKLFRHCEVVFYCGDHETVGQALHNQLSPGVKLFSWAKDKPADVQILSISGNGPDGCQVSLKYHRPYTFQLPFADRASIENCLHCISYLLYTQFDAEDIQKNINVLSNVQKRLEIKQGINGCYLVDDTYNNDLAGLQIALDLLVQQRHHEKKTVILSDMLQTGREEDVLYHEIAGLLASKDIRRLIGIGPSLLNHRRLFPMEAAFYPSTEEFLRNFESIGFQQELILVKGARQFAFERIVQRLEQKVHGTVLEINLNALTHNLNFYRNKLRPGTKVMVMVKAFAYGSGSFEVANLLQFHRVDYLAVAYADEGIALRRHGIHLPVMVMNPSADSFEAIIRYRLEPEIYSLSLLQALVRHTERDKTKVNIHLKLDTGMHRLGYERKDLERLLPLLIKNPHLKVASIFTHLSGADEALHNEFSARQADEFNRCAAVIEQKLKIKTLKHLLNSAGIIRFPQWHADMVRLGIGLYGIEASQMEPGALQPISTLKTTISQIKHLKKGETVGYGRKGLAEKATKIATIAIGYADGFTRKFSNGTGSVWIRGKEAPVIGNVCMDMTMVDITGINASEGDEVVVFGDARDGISQGLQSLAGKAGTIPYEILTSISERVKRVFYTE